MTQQEPRRFAPGRASEEQEIGISDAARCGADDANRSLPAQQAHHQEGDDDRHHRRNIERQHGANSEKKKKPRQSEREVRHRKDNPFEPAAEKTRGAPKQCGNQGGKKGGGRGEQQGNARAVEQAG